MPSLVGMSTADFGVFLEFVSSTADISADIKRSEL
jgi:hypothetical protein